MDGLCAHAATGLQDPRAHREARVVVKKISQVFSLITESGGLGVGVPVDVRRAALGMVEHM